MLCSHNQSRLCCSVAGGMMYWLCTRTGAASMFSVTCIRQKMPSKSRPFLRPL